MPLDLVYERAAPPSVQLAPVTDLFLTWVQELVLRYRMRLASYARKRGLCCDDALDCVQEAFLTFMRLPQARLLVAAPDESLKLLTVLVRHRICNWRRSNRSRARKERIEQSDSYLAWECSIETRVAQLEQLSRIACTVESLPRLQQEVVRMSVFEGASADEVAAALSLSPGHVRVVLHRAREQLRSCTHDD